MKQFSQPAIQRLFKGLILITLLFLVTELSAQQNKSLGRIQISGNGHFFEYENHKPFFWLGDTAWELFSRLNKKEIESYLENRRQKGFNVIQAVVIANLGKPLKKNQYGDIPLLDNDPEKPNEKYFELIDWTIQLALKKSIYIALLPTWGDKVSKLSGTGSALFSEDNAYRYGLFLGNRYKNYTNLIWISGGDHPAFTDSADFRPVWRSMIKGIKKGTDGKALITYHTLGERSSTYFWKDDPILDFNMIQSGHGRRDIPIWNWIFSDFSRSPAKPVLDGEPNYEDHPVNWKVENGYFRDYDVRKQLYRSVFSGAAGVTYGHQAVWQFYSPREQAISAPDRYWTDAVDRPGAFQAGYLKKLMDSRPQLNRVPDQKIITTGQGVGGEFITAFSDAGYSMIYLPVGKKIEVDVLSKKSKKMRVIWFNPRNGRFKTIGVIENRKSTWLVPPTLGVEHDWVLVIDYI